jgi:hypothetical protein
VAGDPAWWTLFFEEYGTDHRPSIAGSYYEATRRYRKDRPVCASDAIPTLGVVTNFLKRPRTKQAMKLLRHGTTAWKETQEDHVDRDWTVDGEGNPILVGDLLFGDHRKLDFWIRYTDPETGETRVIRPWLTGWYDARSGVLVGWLLSAAAPGSRAVLATLIYAIKYTLRGTTPKYLCTDNGEDYRYIGLFKALEVEGQTLSVAQALGIEPHFAQAYNGRAKLIERFFKDLAGRFDKRFPSYCGCCPADRPELAEVFRGDASQLLELDQVGALLDEFLLDWEQQPTESKVIAGATRAAAWATWLPIRRPLADHELWSRALVPRKLVQVRRGGRITYEGGKYWHEAIRQHLFMSDTEYVVYEDLLVGRDAVYLGYQDGRMITDPATGLPLAIPLVAQTPAIHGGEALKERQRIIHRQTQLTLAHARDLQGGQVDHHPYARLAALHADATPRALPAAGDAPGPQRPASPPANPALTKQLYDLLHPTAETPAGQPAPASDLAAQLKAMRDAGELQ